MTVKKLVVIILIKKTEIISFTVWIKFKLNGTYNNSFISIGQVIGSIYVCVCVCFCVQLNVWVEIYTIAFIINNYYTLFIINYRDIKTRLCFGLYHHHPQSVSSNPEIKIQVL